jgi:hypothetical protein
MQRRYHMQPRSQLISGLLFAATVCVDAVAVSWAYGTNLNRTESLYFGLICAQISLLGIWSGFSAAPRFWRWLTPMVLTLAAVLLTYWLYRHSESSMRGVHAREMGMAYLSLWIVQVALVMTGVWILRRASFVQKWEQHPITVRWQFSLMHLLMLMTMTAILLVILREAKVIHEIWLSYALWVINNSVLAIIAVFLCTVTWHIVLRMGALAAMGAALGIAVGLIDPFHASDAVAINLIQTATLFLWLELGGIIRCMPVRSAPSPPTN